MPPRTIQIEIRISDHDHIPPQEWALGVKNGDMPSTEKFKRAVEYLFDHARYKLKELLDA